MDYELNAFKDYELITIGRYYNDEEKEKILSLVAKANMLNSCENKNLKEIVQKEGVSCCESVNECKNMIYILQHIQKNEREIELTRAKMNYLKKLGSMNIYEDRQDMLNATMIKNHSLLIQTLDAGIISFLSGKVDIAIELIEKVAKERLLCAMKIVGLLYKERNELKNAYTYYAFLSKKVRENSLLEQDDRYTKVLESITNTKGFTMEANQNFDKEHTLLSEENLTRFRCGF